MKRLIALAAGAVAAFSCFTNASQAAGTEFVGGYTANAVIYLATPVPAGGSVWCSLTIILAGEPATNTETVIGQATITGGHANCSLHIPVEWLITDGATDSVTGEFSTGIFSTATVQGSVIGGTNSVRFGTHSLPPIQEVPATVPVWNITTRL
jgi:hypothetical protein